jgi:plastocyanin
MGTRNFPVAFTVLATAVAVAGCGGSGSTKPVATRNVEIPKSYKFEPKAIIVKAGDTVTWTNKDNFTHRVKVDGGADHKVDRGHSVSVRFDKPGTYHYVCTLHPHDMNGEVIVR